jgi:hypothetical protein
VSWRDRHFGRRAPTSADDDWRRRHFGIRTLADRVGLLPAPERAEASHELVAARELEQREIDRERAIDQRLTDEIRAAERRRQIDAWRPLVAAYGVDVVERIQRRVDPSFRLPDELKEDR